MAATTRLKEQSIFSERTLTDESGLPLLRYTFSPWELPVLSKRAEKRIKAYHKNVEQQWRTLWETRCLAEAKQAMSRALAASRPFTPYAMSFHTTILFHRGNILCIRQDAVEDTGSGAPTVFPSAVTWNTEACAPLTLSSFFQKERHWKRRVLEAICQQGRQMADSGEYWLYEPLEPLLNQFFSPDNFFLTPEGLSVFYPMCSIASSAEGILTFPLPIGDFCPCNCSENTV